MKAIFCDIKEREQWDDFVKKNSFDFGLLQSFSWGDFVGQVQSLSRAKPKDPKSKVQSCNVFRLAVIDEGENFLAVAQIIKQKLPLGQSYFYLPRGPVFRLSGEKFLIFNPSTSLGTSFQFSILEFLFAEIKKLAQKEKAIFLRFDPPWKPPLNLLLIKGEKIKNSGQVQPPATLILDLTLPAEQLLAQMKPKTRYNIKVAQKHCLTIDEGENYFSDFWRLMEVTARRDQFIPHVRNYYQTMLEVLGKGGELKLIVAKDGDKAIAANLVIFYGDWCVYLHGASDYNSREKMASYLLQWEAMLTAKSQGKKYYDFWGVDEKKWPGITRFKQSFAPQKKITQYLGSWDIIYRPAWYRLYRLIKKLIK